MTVFLHSSTYSLLKRRTYYGFCTQIMVFTFFRATAVSRQPWSHNTSSSSTGVKTSESARGTGFEVDIKPFLGTRHPLPIISRKFSLFKPYFFPPNNYHFPLVDHPAGSFEILRIFWQWISWITPSPTWNFDLALGFGISLRGIFSK